METLTILLVTVAVAAIVWRLAAFLAGALAWLLVAVIAFSLLAGVSVPSAAVGAAVTLWTLSQVVSRIRNGYWRSRMIRGLTNVV